MARPAWVELHTPRLRVCPLTEAHLPWLVRWEADPVLRDLNDDDPSPADPADVEATVRGWLRADRRDILPFAIFTRDGDRCIGWCMIAEIDAAAGEGCVGLTIGERGVWGRGLGREALEALVSHALGPLGLARVLAEVHAFNRPAVRLVERAGFRLLRRDPGAVRRGEKAWDSLVYVRER